MDGSAELAWIPGTTELSLSADEARMLLTVEDTRGADLMMVEGVR